MKGISEERLTQLLGEAYGEYEELFICNLLNNECKELQPWQPIESAPKDRPVLLYGGHVPCCQMFVEHADANWYWKPAHWCELPLDPPSV